MLTKTAGLALPWRFCFPEVNFGILKPGHAISAIDDSISPGFHFHKPGLQNCPAQGSRGTDKALRQRLQNTRHSPRSRLAHPTSFRFGQSAYANANADVLQYSGRPKILRPFCCSTRAALKFLEPLQVSSNARDDSTQAEVTVVHSNCGALQAFTSRGTLDYAANSIPAQCVSSPEEIRVALIHSYFSSWLAPALAVDSFSRLVPSPFRLQF
jgi:hypothetical protein